METILVTLCRKGAVDDIPSLACLVAFNNSLILWIKTKNKKQRWWPKDDNGLG